MLAELTAVDQYSEPTTFYAYSNHIPTISCVVIFSVTIQGISVNSFFLHVRIVVKLMITSAKIFQEFEVILCLSQCSWNIPSYLPTVFPPTYQVGRHSKV